MVNQISLHMANNPTDNPANNLMVNNLMVNQDNNLMVNQDNNLMANQVNNLMVNNLHMVHQVNNHMVNQDMDSQVINSHTGLRPGISQHRVYLPRHGWLSRYLSLFSVVCPLV